MWEDPHCQAGGMWSIRVPKSYTNKYWEDLALALIGDQFTDESEVNGLIIQLKPSMDNIQIWNKSGSDVGKVERLKADIENVLKLDEGMKLDYMKFADALAKYSALPKKEEENNATAQERGQPNAQGYQRGGYTRGGRGGNRGGYN